MKPLHPALHRPFARHSIVSTVSFFLLLTAFLLLLLVAISLPITKTVYLLSVKSTVVGGTPTSIATDLRFGVWGFCASSVLSQPYWFSNHGACYGPKLGYDVPPNFATLAGVSPDIVHAVQKGLLVILVLHAVAAGLSFLGFIFSCFLGPHDVAVVTLIVAIVTGLVTALVFAIDLAIVIIARQGIKNLGSYHFQVDWGDGTWMILAAVIATWIAVIFLSARACYCCGVRRHPNYDNLFISKKKESLKE